MKSVLSYSIVKQIFKGTLMIVVGGFLGFNTFISPNTQRIEGTVVSEVETYDLLSKKRGYNAVVEYQVEGKTYTVTQSPASENHPVIGDKRTVQYDKSDPETSKLPTRRSDAIVYVLPIAGLVLLLSGVWDIIVRLRRGR